jgi:hypothetical protein
MHALAYQNTLHTIPNWVPFFDKEPRGIAYETDTHFVHFFGRDSGLWVISSGLTVTEAKSGTLEDWVVRTFGANDILSTQTRVGCTIRGVWRPGLYFDDEMLQGLNAALPDLRLAEQSLLLLVQRLDELLHFVEPTANSLGTYSHKSRELLVLSCMEVENYWNSYLEESRVPKPVSGFSTNHYVKLLNPLFLDEYEITLPRYASVPATRPFQGWSSTNPTKSLRWYDAYNKTKHNRASHFDEATLANCISAVAANLVLFSVRHGPFRLFNSAGTLAAYFNQLFSIRLVSANPQSFYVPKIQLKSGHRPELMCFGSRELSQPWECDPLTV